MDLIKDLPILERPREKALHYGITALSTRELLAVLLRTGIKGQSVLEVADCVLRNGGGLKGVARMSLYELSQIKGISKTKALELQACLELAKRVSYEEALHENIIQHPEHVMQWLKLELGSLQQEEFYVLFLDNANQILSYDCIFKGTVNMSMVSPREIFREALLRGACKLIVVHNHPSGILTPSEADLLVTYKLVELGERMDIPVLDHLIVSKQGFFSLQQAGLLTPSNT